MSLPSDKLKLVGHFALLHNTSNNPIDSDPGLVHLNKHERQDHLYSYDGYSAILASQGYNLAREHASIRSKNGMPVPLIRSDLDYQIERAKMMKSRNPDEHLIEMFGICQAYLKGRNYISAVTYAATIFYCLPNLPLSVQEKWKSRLKEIFASAELVAAARNAIEQNAARLVKVLSVGDKWNEDEILLILQTRIEIDMLRHFLLYQGTSQDKTNLDSIDAKIEELRQSKNHSRDFNLVVKMIKRNWNVPLHSKWLEPI